MKLSTWLRQLWQGKKLRRGLPQTSVFPRLYSARLEERHLLNGVPLVQVDALGGVVIGAGSAANDGVADSFQISRVQENGADQVRVNVNGQVAFQAAATDVHSVRIVGSSDADRLTVDPAVLPAGSGPAGRIEFLGGDGPQLDTLEVAALSRPVTSVSYTIAPAGGDLLVQDTNDQSLAIQFTGVESLRDLLVAEQRGFQFTGAGETVTLSDGESADGFTRLTSSFGTTIDFVTPQGSLAVDARDADPLDGDLIRLETLNEWSPTDLQVTGDQLDHVVFAADSQIELGSHRLTVYAGDVEVDGTIIARGDAEGEIGGTVQLLGEELRVSSTARIDVSGYAGGGTVLIGGDFQGANPLVPNARQTIVEQGAIIAADGLVHGDGGKIIVWADEVALVDGSGGIRARGGSESGNGGLVETSGRQYLRIGGAVDASAPRGSAGTWWLDPRNVAIVTGGTATLTGGELVPTTDNTQIADTTIETALAAGTNVTIYTGITGTQSGNITVTTAIDANMGANTATLSLIAANDVIVNAAIQNTTSGAGELNVVLQANATVAGKNDDLNAASGSVDINATITTLGGNFSSSGVNFDNTGGTINAGGGTVALTQTGAITIGASVTTSGTGGITLTSTGGSVSVNAAVSATGSGAIDVNSAAAFTLANGIVLSSSTGNVTVDTAGVNALTVNGDITTGGSGTITLTGSNAITMDASSLVQTANGAIVLTSAAGGVTVDVVQSTGSAAISITATGAAILEADNTARVGASGSTSVLALNSATVGGAGGNQELNTNVGVLRVTATGNVRVTEATAVQLGDGTGNVTSSGGTLTISASGAITTGNTLSTTGGNGSISLTAAAGSIGIDHAVSAHGTGGISLTASGGTSDLEINANIQTASGAVFLTAGRDIKTDGTGDVIATTAGSGSARIDAANSIGTSSNPIDLDVATVAAQVTGTGNIFLNQIDGVQDNLTIGAASGLNGLTTTSGDISVVVQAGNLTVAQGVAATGAGQISLTAAGTNKNLTINEFVRSSGGTITLNATGDVSLNNASADVKSHGTGTSSGATAGAIDVHADTDGDGTGNFVSVVNSSLNANATATDANITIDAADFQHAGLIDAGTAVVWLAPTNDRTVAVGNAGGSQFNVSDTEWDATATAGITAARLEIGSATSSGDLTIAHDTVGAFGPTGSGGGTAATTLILLTNGAILDDADATDGTLTVANLGLDAGLNVGGTTTATQLKIDVTNLAARSDGDAAAAGHAINIQESTSVATDTITSTAKGGNIVGLSTGDGGVTLVTLNGGITVASDGAISAGDEATNAGNFDVVLTTAETAEGTAADIALTGTVTADRNVLLNSADAITGSGLVTAGNLVELDGDLGIGTSGTRINTSAAILAARNTSSTGGIFVTEANAVEVGDGVNFNGITGGSNNTIDVRTTAGSLTVASSVTAIGTGAITLDAAGQDSDLLVNSAIDSASGSVTLSADDEVSFAAAGDVSSTSGNVLVTANAETTPTNGNGTDGIVMVNGAVIDAGSGTISLVASGTHSGSITLGGLTTTSSSATSVTISTEAAVLDGGDMDVDVVSAGRLVIDARTGVGSGNAIETDVVSLDVDNATSGNIDIAEADDVTIQNLTQSTAGNIQVATTNGSITVNGGTTTIVAAGAGTVTLDANGTDSDVVVNQGVQSASGDIVISADDTVLFAVAGDITSTSGDVSITANASNSNGDGNDEVLMADGAVINAGSGTITVSVTGSSGGDITIGQLVTTNPTTTSVVINAANGAVVDADTDSGNDVTSGGRLVIDAKLGVGNTNDLETSVASLDVENATSGNIEITDANVVTVFRAAQATAGNISIGSSAGTITVDNGGAVTNAIVAVGSGTITLDVLGATSSIVVNDGIQSASGDVTLTAADDVTFAAEGDITSVSGDVKVQADTDNGGAASGAITMADGSVIGTGGTIDLDADENITLGRLVTTNATSTAVKINTTEGGLVDGGDTGGADIEATAAGARVVVNVVGNLGAVTNIFTEAGFNAIETQAADLDLTSGGVIAVVDSNATAPTLTRLNAKSGAAGTLLFKASAAIDVSSTAGLEAADTIGLVSTGSTVTAANGLSAANLRLEGTDVIRSGGGNLDLNATTALLFMSGTTETITITAAQFDGTAGGAFSVTNDSSALQLIDLDNDGTALTTVNTFGVSVHNTAGTLTVTNDVVATGSGGVTLDADGTDSDVVVNDAIQAGTGGVTITADDSVTFAAAGDVTVTGAGNVSVTANVTTTSGDTGDKIQMADGSRIDAGSGTITLSASGTNGGSITLGGLATTNSSATSVSLTTNAAIIDGGDAHVNVATAGRLVIASKTGVGASGAIETSVASVDIVNATSGNVAISDTDAVTVIRIDTQSDVAVTAGGNIAVANITTTATSNTSVVLNALGAVTEDSPDAAADITTSGRLVIDATAGIGAGNALETAAVSFDVETTGAAAIDIDNTLATDVSIIKLATIGGAINFDHTGGGELTVTASGSGGQGVTSGDNATDGGDITLSATGNFTVDAVISSDLDAANPNGTLVADGVTLNVAPVVGAGNITLNGGNQDTIIATASITASHQNITATRDIIIRARVEVTRSNRDVLLTADSNNDGVGGVRIEAAGQVIATRDILITGSDVFALAGTTESVQIDADGANVQLQAGREVRLQSSNVAPTAADIVVNGRITANGDFLVSAENDITFGGNGDVTANGAVTLTADRGVGNTGGVIAMADGTVIDAGNGVMNLIADGNITLGRLVTTNNTATAVVISTMSGSVVDAGDTTGLENIEANGANAVVTINAVTGVGAAAAIETQISRLDLDNTTSGNVSLLETGSIRLVKLNQAGSGNVALTAGGAILDANNLDHPAAGANVRVAANDASVRLTAGTSIGGSGTARLDVAFGGTGSDLLVDAGTSNQLVLLRTGSARLDTLSITARANTTQTIEETTAGDLAGLGIASYSVTPAAGQQTLMNIATSGLDFTFVAATGNLLVGSVNASAGNVALTSTAGFIRETALNTTTDITTSGTLTLSASTGIGQAGTDQELDTNVGTLNATSSTGGIFLQQAGNLTIGAVSTTTSGHIDLGVTAGSATVAGAITAAGAGNVTVTAGGAASDLAINGDIQTGSGAIFLTAGNAITTNGTGDVIATVDGSGTLRLDAGNAIGTNANRIDIDVATVAAQLTSPTATGDVFLNQINGVQDDLTVGSASGLAGIATQNNRNLAVVVQNGTLTLSENVTAAGTGDVHLRAIAGNIVQPSGTRFIVADTLALEADGTIGTAADANAIDLQVNTVAARSGLSAGTNKSIFLNQGSAGGALTIGTATNLHAGGTLDGVAVAGGTSGSVSVTTEASDLTVNRNVTALGTGTISLAAGGADSLFTLDAATAIDTSNQAITITADHMALAASGTIGGDAETITLRQHTASATVEFVADATADALGVMRLSDSDLDALANVNGLTIVGRTNGGAIAVSDDTSVLGDSLSLHLQSGGSVSGAGDVTAANLAITAGGNIDVETLVTNFAATTTAGFITVDEQATGNALTIAAVNGVEGISATGAISVSVAAANGAGGLNVNRQLVSSSASPVTLTVANENDLTIGDLGNGRFVQSTGGGVVLNSGGGIVLNHANANVRSHGGATAGLIDINADTNNNGTGTFTSVAGATLNTNATTTDGRIEIDAADFVHAGSADSGSSVIHLAPTAGRTIGLGSSGADFNVSSAELNNLTASRVELGYLAATGDHTASGNVTLTSDVAMTASNTLVLNTSGTINADATLRTLSVQNLALRSGSGINTANTFRIEGPTPGANLVAAEVTSVGNLTLLDPTAITVGAVATDADPAFAGLTTFDGDVALGTTNGSISIAEHVAAGDNGGNQGRAVMFTSGDANPADNSGDSLFSLDSNRSITAATNGSITITADRMTIDATGTSIDAGTGIVTLQQFATLATNANASIDLGGSDAFESPAASPDRVVLGLTDDELGRVTAGELRIGATDGGAIVISSAISTDAETGETNPGLVHFRSGGTITQTAAITETNLAITAGGAVTLTNAANEFGTLAAVAAGTIQIADASSLTIGTVAGVAGLTANRGSITVKTAGALGDLRVDGTIVAQDNIVLDAGRDAVFLPGAVVETRNSGATLQVFAGGNVITQPGVLFHVGSSDPANDATFSGFPLHVMVRPLQVSPGVNVSSLGEVSIEVTAGAPADESFLIEIDWGDGPLESTPSAGHVTVIDHTYTGNPGQRTTDDIRISVSIMADSLGRLQFFQAGNIADPITVELTVNLTVPSSGLIGATAQFETVVFAAAVVNFERAETSVVTQVVSQPVTTRNLVSSGTGTSATTGVRRYVLRIVTPTSESGEVRESLDIPLDDNVLDDMAGLFDKLGDDRYRIYQILENGTQALVKDVTVRNHKAADASDEEVDVLRPRRAAPSTPADSAPASESEMPDATPDEQRPLLELAPPANQGAHYGRHTALAMSLAAAAIGARQSRGAGIHPDRSFRKAARLWRKDAGD